MKVYVLVTNRQEVFAFTMERSVKEKVEELFPGAKIVEDSVQLGWASAEAKICVVEATEREIYVLCVDAASCLVYGDKESLLAAVGRFLPGHGLQIWMIRVARCVTVFVGESSKNGGIVVEVQDVEQGAIQKAVRSHLGDESVIVREHKILDWVYEVP